MTCGERMHGITAIWRTVWVLAGLLGLGAAWSAPLTLAVSRGPVSLPLYVAEAQGYFKAAGLEAKLSECSSGRHCLQMLSGGQADVATGAELLVTLNSFGRADLVILGTLSSSSAQIRLVARRSSIQSPAQLVGKRVATVMGTSAQYYLNNWLLFEGIEPRTVQMLARSPDQLVDTLRRGEADAVVVWEPLASQAAVALGEDAVFLPAAGVYTQHFNLIALRSGVAAREPELLALMQALVQAQRFISADPAAAKALLKQRLAVDDATASAYLKEHDFRIRLDQSLITTMESQARWAVQEKQVPVQAKGVNLLLSIEPGLLRKVAPGSVLLVR